MTKDVIQRRLAELAEPGAGFIRSVRLAENAVAGYSFANGWVSCPPPTPDIPQGELPLISVSGHARDPETSLRLLLMEAVERHCSVFAGSEGFRTARVGDLGTSCVPDGLPANVTIRCLVARSLSSSLPVLVPAAHALLGYGLNNEPMYALADSTGCAAGETRDEASYRGLLEVVERDAVAIWWFNRVERPSLDFCDDDQLTAIQQALQMERRRLTLLDITHDLGVPVVVAVSADRYGRRIYFGSAADMCYRRAARRAASEMLQFWFWGRVSADPPSRMQWLKEESFSTQPWLKPNKQLPLPPALSIDLSLDNAADRIIARQYDVLVLELTRQRIEIPVVRTFVPGLVNHRSGAPFPRMLDVPQKLGWVSQRRRREELMSYPCPI